MKKPTKKPSKKNKKIADIMQISIQDILPACNNDEGLALFFMEWLHNGQNATQAYLKTHPNVTEKTARVMGARLLAKVDKRDIMESLDLGTSRFFQQLDRGLSAGKTYILKKYDKEGKVIGEIKVIEEDHKTRDSYHERQGRLLGYLNDKSNTTLNQFNFDFTKLSEAIAQSSKERGLPV